MVRFITLALCFWVACEGGNSGPVRLALGATCTVGGDAACASGYCAKLDTGSKICSQPCNAAVTCPMGWTCRDDSDPPLCVPVASSRRCSEDVIAGSACLQCDRAVLVPAQRQRAHRVQAMSNVPKAFNADHKPGVGSLFKFVKRMTTARKGSVATDFVAPRMGVVVERFCKPCVTDVECGSQSDFVSVSCQRSAALCECLRGCRRLPRWLPLSGLRWRSSMCAIRWSLRGAMLGG